MTEVVQRWSVAVSLGLSAAWWTWNFLAWRREQALAKRLETIAGTKPKKRGPLIELVARVRRFAVHRLQSRRWRRDVPDFFELLALAQSAGMSLPRAWTFSSMSMEKSALAPLLANVDALIRVGQSWDRSLSAFSDDVDDERCAWTIGLMRQNLRRGSPLSDLLVDQVEQWRYADAMAAERRAQTLSLRLLLPIFIFLLPAVFIVLFAPLLLPLLEGGTMF